MAIARPIRAMAPTMTVWAFTESASCGLSMRGCGQSLAPGKTATASADDFALVGAQRRRRCSNGRRSTGTTSGVSPPHTSCAGMARAPVHLLSLSPPPGRVREGHDSGGRWADGSDRFGDYNCGFGPSPSGGEVAAQGCLVNHSTAPSEVPIELPCRSMKRQRPNPLRAGWLCFPLLVTTGGGVTPREQWPTAGFNAMEGQDD